MPLSILVTGATGKLGRLIVQRLLDLGEPVRAFTRRPDVADALFGDRVELAEGDFRDPLSVARALTGVDRVVLLSPIGERLAQDQIAVIGAAEAARVERIVKISGSDWTVDPPGRSISGAAHAEVERRLAASRIASVALRPNAWMQVSLPSQIARIKAGQALVAAYGDALVSFIDARDIADVTVQQCLAPELAQGPLVLTGAQSLGIGDVAKLASRITKRDLAVDAAPSNGLAPLGFEQRAVAEFMVLLREGRAAATTSTVADLLGRPPRTVEAFLAEHLEPVAA